MSNTVLRDASTSKKCTITVDPSQLTSKVLVLDISTMLMMIVLMMMLTLILMPQMILVFKQH